MSITQSSPGRPSAGAQNQVRENPRSTSLPPRLDQTFLTNRVDQAVSHGWTGEYSNPDTDPDTDDISSLGPEMAHTWGSIDGVTGQLETVGISNTNVSRAPVRAVSSSASSSPKLPPSPELKWTRQKRHLERMKQDLKRVLPVLPVHDVGPNRFGSADARRTSAALSNPLDTTGRRASRDHKRNSGSIDSNHRNQIHTHVTGWLQTIEQGQDSGSSSTRIDPSKSLVSSPIQQPSNRQSRKSTQSHPSSRASSPAKSVDGQKGKASLKK